MPDSKMMDWLKASDLGLSYEAALHGVQSSIANGFYNSAMEPKHMRTGVDASKADALGLVCLLIDKGVITNEEYIEAIRLSMNKELETREKDASTLSGVSISFRGRR